MMVMRMVQVVGSDSVRGAGVGDRGAGPGALAFDFLFDVGHDAGGGHGAVAFVEGHFDFLGVGLFLGGW